MANIDNKELIALGAKIRAAREAAGLTQDELAQRCNLSRIYISLLERGQRNPTYLVLLQLAQTLNLKLSDY